MPNFLEPIWLILIIPIIAVFILLPFSSRTVSILRGLFVLLVIFSAAGMAIYQVQPGGTVVVVADRSLSMPVDAADRQKEIIKLLGSNAKQDDKIAVVSFGQKAEIELPPVAAKTSVFSDWSQYIDSDGSELSAAIDKAVSLIPTGSSGRILLLTDGRYTGINPLYSVISSNTNVPIDYRIIERSEVSDVCIERFDVPSCVDVGQAFYLTGWISLPSSQEIQYRLLRGQTVIVSGKKNCSAGRTSLVFRDRADASIGLASALSYRLEVTPAGQDPITENNVADTIVGILKRKPILHLTSGGKSGLTKLLSAAKMEIDSKDPAEVTVNLDLLGQYRAVILENVSAKSVSSQGLETIKSWVEHSGGGLLITGGKNSFGLGGYFRSPVEKIMPVSMELRKEHRKLSLALSVVLDRSGSMAVSVEGNRTKMDLANLGTCQTLEILSGQDQLGVIAVDSSAHIIAPLQGVENRESLQKKIRSIESSGGGIFIYEGLSHAAAMLSKAESLTRHIILFADASDSEEPGAYKKLLENCVKSGITCSVIALGSESDCDAELLKDIARRGQGRCFFTDKAEDLPALFTQDTFTVTRNSFLEDPVAISFSPLLESVTGQKFPSPPQLGGYNLTYLQPQTQLCAVSTDEYSAPIVAVRYSGLGRTACFTGQIDGQYTGAFGAWDKLDAFYTSLIRWTAGEQSVLPPSLLLTQQVIDGTCQLRLHLPDETNEQDRQINTNQTNPTGSPISSDGGTSRYDGSTLTSDNSSESNPDSNSESNLDTPSWNELFLNNKPMVSVVRAKPDQSSVIEDPLIPLSWLDGNTMGADIPLYGNQRIIATVVFDRDKSISMDSKPSEKNPSAVSSQPFTVAMPPVCRMYSPEFNSSTSRIAQSTTLLQRLANVTQGKQRTNVTEIWSDIQSSSRQTPLYPILLLVAVVLFLLEVLQRRTGIISTLARQMLILLSQILSKFRITKMKGNTISSESKNINADNNQENNITSDTLVQKTISETTLDSPAVTAEPVKPQKSASSQSDSPQSSWTDALKKAKNRANKRNE